jgi:hypothetical protein
MSARARREVRSSRERQRIHPCKGRGIARAKTPTIGDQIRRPGFIADLASEQIDEIQLH